MPRAKPIADRGLPFGEIVQIAHACLTMLRFGDEAKEPDGQRKGRGYHLRLRADREREVVPKSSRTCWRSMASRLAAMLRRLEAKYPEPNPLEQFTRDQRDASILHIGSLLESGSE